MIEKIAHTVRAFRVGDVLYTKRTFKYNNGRNTSHPIEKWVIKQIYDGGNVLRIAPIEGNDKETIINGTTEPILTVEAWNNAISSLQKIQSINTNNIKVDYETTNENVIVALYFKINGIVNKIGFNYNDVKNDSKAKPVQTSNINVSIGDIQIVSNSANPQEVAQEVQNQLVALFMSQGLMTNVGEMVVG